MGDHRGSRVARREFLRSIGGLAASLCLGGASATTWAQQSDAEWQAAVDAGWKAFWAGKYPDAIDAFLRARDLGRLRPYEYWAISRSLAELRRDGDAMAAAEECDDLHRSPDSLAVVALAHFHLGNTDAASETAVKATRLAGEQPTDGPLVDAQKRLATRQIVLRHHLDYQSLNSDGQRIYNDLGHYVSFEPRTEPWQKVEVLDVKGAERHEEYRDADDNRMLKLWQSSKGPVEVTYRIVRHPRNVRR
jgi:tetratricopeptide (TPR) repeat protein